MPDPTIPPSDAESQSPADKARSANRRRLLQGGLAAAPVLMTLVSRPVLAQQCTSPSTFASGNVSKAGQGIACTGRTPGYWSKSQWYGSWPSPFYPTTVHGPGGHKATMFDGVFTPKYSGKTLLDVLNMGGGPPDDVARHCVAALLNAAAKWSPAPSTAVVQGIWTEYIQKSYFEPMAGVKWNNTQIVTYLTSTMPL